MDRGLSGIALQIKYSWYFLQEAGWQESSTCADNTLWLVADGAAQFTCEGKAMTANAGDAVLLLPGDKVHIFSAAGVGCQCIYFSLDAGNTQDMLRKNNAAGIYHLPEYAENLRRSLGKDHLLFTLDQYAHFMTFLSQLGSRIGSQRRFYEVIPKSPDLKLNRLISEMESRAPQMIPIRELAEFMGMSEKYFIQFFHQKIGCSPRSLMNRQRMHYAAKLLSDPGVSLAEAAQTLGFSDVYAFSKAFKHYFGESPGSFRKKS